MNSLPTDENSSDSTSRSQAYPTLKDDLDSSEMWTSMSPAERLPIILDNFTDPEEWFTSDVLTTLVFYRHSPIGRWGQIKARYKSIGGNPYDLEKEVVDILTALKDGDSCHPSRDEQAFSLSLCPRARIFRAATTSAWYV